MNIYTDIGFQPTNLRASDVNPAWVPAGLVNTQDGMMILQQVWAMYVNSVTNCAQTPARIRYLNEACVNNFQNAEVTAAISEIMDFVKMATFDNVPGWQNSLNAFVDEVVLFRVSLLIANDQYLQSLLDQTQYSEVSLVLEKYRIHKEKTELYRQRGAQGAGFNAPGLGTGRAMMNRGGFNNGNNNAGGFAAAPFAGNGGGATQTPQQPMYKKKFVGGKKTQVEDVYQHKTHQTQTLLPRPGQQVAETTEQLKLQWLPHKEQPYFLLLDSEKETYDLVVKNEKVYFEIRGYKEGEIKVERGQHQIRAVSNLTQLPPTKWASRNVAAQQTMVALSVGMEKDPQVQTEQEKEFISKNIKTMPGTRFTVDSLSEAVRTARIVHKRVLGEDYVGTCYRTEFNIRNVFVTITDQLPILKALSSYANFARIAQEMSKLYEAATTGGEFKQTLARLDRYLAKHVNELLRSRLGLTVTIDSFMDDISDVEPFVQKKNGQGYADLFIESQAEFIESVMNFQDFTEEYKDSVVVSTDQEEDGQQLYYFGPVRAVSVTTMDLLAEELKLGFCDNNPKLPALIRESTHPHLYTFAQASLSGAVAARKKLKAHYVVTADDVIYSLTKGMIGDDSYLISKVS